MCVCMCATTSVCMCVCVCVYDLTSLYLGEEGWKKGKVNMYEMANITLTVGVQTFPHIIKSTINLILEKRCN